MIKRKRLQLETNVNSYLSECLKSCNRIECVYKIGYGNFEFKRAFENEKVSSILSNSTVGKFILLDQYGFKEVDNDVFLKLIKSPRTDFIFFISSSFIRRFKEHPNITRYFETNKIDFEKSKPHECHKYVAKYFRSLVPNGLEFYLHHFTIKKGTNYHGLIFGTSHTLGMEKFLKVCWTHDKMAGESNFSMYNDFKMDNLFYTETNTVLLNLFKADLTDKILQSKLKSSISAMKYTLSKGVQTKVYLEVITNLLDLNKIQIEGKFNKKIANIHRLKDNDFYKFKVV